jgi:uncharacterized protein (DUF305 family)
MRTTHPFTHRRRRVAALLAAACAAILVSGCGADDAPEAATASPPPSRMSPVPSNASYNSADVVFAQDLLVYLRQSMDMTRLAKTRATNPEVKALAVKAEKDREAGLILLPMWLDKNHQPQTAGQGGGAAVSTDAIAALGKAEGAAFDKLFLETMLTNDEAAANLLTAQQWSGMSGPLMSLAHKVSADQQVEMAELRRLLNR